MITNTDYIKYIDRNNYLLNSKEDNKRVEELIDKRTPYKEMTEREIELVIMYHAINMAKLISKKRESEKRNKIFEENYQQLQKLNKESFNKHLEMCNAIIEKEQAEKSYYEKQSKK